MVSALKRIVQIQASVWEALEVSPRVNKVYTVDGNIMTGAEKDRTPKGASTWSDYEIIPRQSSNHSKKQSMI